MSPPRRQTIQFLYATIIFVVAGVVIWSITTGIVTGKDVSVAFLASLGTFLGALFAFRLNESKETSKKLSEQRAALNRALFVLARQRNAIKSFAKYLQPFNSDIERALMLPAHKPPRYEDLRQDFESIEFLLENGKANILMRIAIEDERFHQTFESIRIRNDFYVTEVQPELSRHGFQGKDVTEKQLLEALGERIYGTAINYSNGLYFHVAKSMESIPSMHADVFAVAKDLFPNDKFISFEADA
ncbi:MAG: hypothetical protein WAW02_05635 [Sideroxyarcus sp.]